VSQKTVQDEITALLKTIPQVDVYRGKTSDEVIKLVGESIAPFITINFGGLIKPRRGTNGITGAKASSNIMEFTIRCIASTDENASYVAQAAWDKLIGYVPANAGEIDSVLYGGVGEVSALGNPTRFGSVQSYACLVNSDFT
jgi:hypothetical protein